MEDQARLNRTQDIREKIVAATMKNGAIPVDRDDREFLMKAIEGIDRQVLSKAKIKSDDQNSKAQTEAASMIASLLLQAGQQHKAANHARAERELVLDMPDLKDIVPGETDIGVHTFTYGDIVKDK